MDRINTSSLEELNNEAARIGLSSGNNGDVEHVNNNDHADDIVVVEAYAMNEKETEAKFIQWYEDVSEERTRILAELEERKMELEKYKTAEEAYTKRIDELERTSSELLSAFEGVQKELKFLREKYEPPLENDTYFERYDTVLKDRDRLQKTVRENKDYINLLEEQVEKFRQNIDDRDKINENKTKISQSKLRDHNMLVRSTTNDGNDELGKVNKEIKSESVHIEAGHDRSSIHANISDTKLDDNFKHYNKIRLNQKSYKKDRKICDLPSITTHAKRYSSMNRVFKAEASPILCGQRHSYPGLNWGLGYKEIHGNRGVRDSFMPREYAKPFSFKAINKYII
ncbi:hypothetical protein DPMN_035237 [Dreissena polymorpha]|uniref:Uncharacterized protein n=1 Tax=Dreissena polymorpha TaxID=45954 RepID=A0A9D4RKU3_DREPO|nr:hypothetical protein DPMN_035237 [Dreissena polymorpha]